MTDIKGLWLEILAVITAICFSMVLIAITVKFICTYIF